MTKTEARAILACNKAIMKALDVCRSKLKSQEKDQFDAYWGANIRQYIEGMCYGAAPIVRAENVLEGCDD